MRANYFASYGATRLAVPRRSNPDATCSEGLIWTNVNLLTTLHVPAGRSSRYHRTVPRMASLSGVACSPNACSNLE
jgi:hypothetical protein